MAVTLSTAWNGYRVLGEDFVILLDMLTLAGKERIETALNTFRSSSMVGSFAMKAPFGAFDGDFQATYAAYVGTLGDEFVGDELFEYELADSIALVSSASDGLFEGSFLFQSYFLDWEGGKHQVTDPVSVAFNSLASYEKATYLQVQEETGDSFTLAVGVLGDGITDEDREDLFVHSLAFMTTMRGASDGTGSTLKKFDAEGDFNIISGGTNAEPIDFFLDNHKLQSFYEDELDIGTPISDNTTDVNAGFFWGTSFILKTGVQPTEWNWTSNNTGGDLVPTPILRDPDDDLVTTGVRSCYHVRLFFEENEIFSDYITDHLDGDGEEILSLRMAFDLADIDSSFEILTFTDPDEPTYDDMGATEDIMESTYTAAGYPVTDATPALLFTATIT